MKNESKTENILKPGLSAEVEITVNDTDTAAHLGSGLVPVYATPALVALMENAAVCALKGFLPEGQTTVGGQIEVRHTAATPVGMKVRARAELITVDGRRLTFTIQAWDALEQIGEARHIRYLVQENQFMEQVSKKGS